jgi:hypothetical protein
MILTIFCFCCRFPASASSLCQQTFELIGKTPGDTSTIYFYEYMDGECAMYTFFGLGLEHDSVTSIKRWWSNDLTLPILDDSTLRGKKLEPAKRLEKQGDAFVVPHGKYHFLSAPKYYQETDKLMLDSISNNLRPFPTTIEEPEMSCPAKLIYSYPGALYLKYEIQDAYIFRGSNMLFLITRQRVFRQGGDTLHGLLIYKLQP